MLQTSCKLISLKIENFTNSNQSKKKNACLKASVVFNKTNNLLIQ